MSVKRKPIWHNQVFPLRPDREEVLFFRNKPLPDFAMRNSPVYEQEDEQFFNHNRNRLERRQVSRRQASFKDRWIDEELTFSMNKLSLVSLVCGLMLLGVLFFITGFLVALSTVVPKQPEQPTSAAIWAAGNAHPNASHHQQASSRLEHRASGFAGNATANEAARVESKVGSNLPAPFQYFVAKGEGQTRMVIAKHTPVPGSSPSNAGMVPPHPQQHQPSSAVANTMPPPSAGPVTSSNHSAPGAVVVPNYTPSSYVAPVAPVAPQAQNYSQQMPISSVRYTLQIAVYDQEISAIRQMNELRQSGHQAYLYPSQHAQYGTIYYLRIGQYLTRQEAETAAATIRQRYQRQPLIIPIQQA